jgi:hypothetical protein
MPSHDLLRKPPLQEVAAVRLDRPGREFGRPHCLDSLPGALPGPSNSIQGPFQRQDNPCSALNLI